MRNNRHGDVEDMLSSGAVDPDIRDDRGNTVLAVATQNNRKRIVKAAVRAGVPLDAQNAQGQTAMHFAYAYGYDELAEYLIRKGANPMVTNVHGLRPDEGLSPDRLVGVTPTLPTKRSADEGKNAGKTSKIVWRTVRDASVK